MIERPAGRWRGRGASFGALARLVVTAVLCAFVLGGGAAWAAQPIVSAGPVTAPAGSGVTGSGTASSTGQGDACINEQHSGANPSAAGSPGAIALNDSSCGQTATPSQPAPASSGQAASGSSSSAPAATEQAGGSSQQAASTQSSVSTQTRLTKRTSTQSKQSTVRGARASTAAVAAAKARGVKVAGVRYLTRTVRGTGRLPIVVTLRDLKAHLVRGAVVTIGGVRGAHATLAPVRTSRTNRHGQATIVLSIAKRLSGQRLHRTVVARTPTAQAIRLASLRLPRLR